MTSNTAPASGGRMAWWGLPRARPWRMSFLLVLTLVSRVAAQASEEGLVVRGLRFSGNHAFADDVLAAAISTSNSSWFARFGPIRWIGLGVERRLNDREFRRDVLRLKTFYQIHGYREAAVDTAVVRTERDVWISFRITEGAPILVRTLDIFGLDSLEKPDRLIRDLPLQVGDPYDRDRLLATADTLIGRIQDRGYPEVQVLLDRREVDLAARTADASLQVAPGKPSVIGEIHVAGTRVIDSSFVRSLLATAPGRPYRGRDLRESQRRLYRSELFRFAAVELDTAHFVPGSGVVPLTIQAIEGPLHRARAAAGYGTNDCFRFGLGWTARNALGSGQIFDVSSQVSKVGVGDPTGIDALANTICSALKEDSIGSRVTNFNVTASFRRPVFITPANAISFSLFAERRSEFLVYLRDDIGASMTLLHETPAGLPISLTYRLSYGGTDATAVSFCAFFNACTDTDIEELRKRRFIATLSAGVQRLRVNNPIDPSRGTSLSADLTHSSNIIGSSKFAQFTRLVGEGAVYRPLGGAVLALHARAGAVVAPRLELGGSAGNFIPPEHRFYAGGPNDVRGFSRNELGPLVYVIKESALGTEGTAIPDSAVRNAATGGNTLVVVNAELRVPSPILQDRLRVGIFVDGGAVWQRGGGAGAGAAFKMTPGIGLRFVTALGPARLDVAYNGYDLPAGRLFVIRSNGEIELLQDSYRRRVNTGRGFVFQFGVGQPF